MGFWLAVRCFGPLLTAASTACLNRSHAPGSVSVSSGFSFFGFLEGFVMIQVQSLKQLLEETREAEDRLALSIGKFIMRFSVMETHINHSIGVILRFPTSKVTRLVTGAIINVNLRLDILSSLANGYKMNDDLRSRFNTAITKARNLNDYRNWLVHDQWSGYQPTTGEWQKIKGETKKKFRFKHRSFSPDDIGFHSSDCYQVAADLSQLTSDYAEWRDAQPTSQQTPP